MKKKKAKTVLFVSTGHGDDKNKGSLQDEGGGAAAVYQEENQWHEVKRKLQSLSKSQDRFKEL